MGRSPRGSGAGVSRVRFASRDGVCLQTNPHHSSLPTGRAAWLRRGSRQSVEPKPRQRSSPGLPSRTNSSPQVAPVQWTDIGICERTSASCLSPAPTSTPAVKDQVKNLCWMEVTGLLSPPGLRCEAAFPRPGCWRCLFASESLTPSRS